jgi:hypothetical protein
MPEWFSDFVWFLYSVVRRWINLIGCAAFAFAQIFYPRITGGRQFPVSSWWLLGACLLFACFQAWREEHAKVRSRDTRAILTDIVDLIQRGKAYGEIRYDWMGALIKHSSDFEDERAVVWVCRELAKQHRDPFARLLLKYSESSLKGKRLKFIRDARVADRQIINDEDAVNYAYSVWADKNGLVKIR